MESTPRRQRSNTIITTSSSGSSDSVSARGWPLHPRGSNGSGARGSTLRAIRGVVLDTLADPQPSSFPAADAVTRALRDVGPEPIGVAGPQAAIVADWLRRNGREVHVLVAPAKKVPRAKRGSVAAKLSAIVAVDYIERTVRAGHLLAHIKELLSPDGRLIAVVSNPTRAGVRLAMLLGRFPDSSHDSDGAQHPVTAAEAERQLTDAGFTVTSVERQLDSIDALHKAGSGVPESVLHMLADDADAMTSHFAFVAEPQGAAVSERLLQRRMDLLMDEQRVAVLRATQLDGRMADLEARVEAFTLLDARLQQLGADQGELAATASRALLAVEQVNVQMSELEERRAADSSGTNRDRALREAREKLLSRSGEIAALVHRIEDAQYRRLILRLRRIVSRGTARGAIIAVVSRGDAELLAFEGRHGWHFPQTERGVYAGHHPADSAAAIAQVDELRARGARYLLVPRTALWWLEYYKEFHQHLLRHGGCLLRNERWGALFTLARPGRTQ